MHANIFTSLHSFTTKTLNASIFMSLNHKILFLASLLFLSFTIFSLPQPMQEEALAPHHDQSSKKQAFHITNDHDHGHVKDKRGRYRRPRKWLPFSQMLPKGHVPPSGSSSCHNDVPDSASVDSVCQDEFSSP